MTIYSYITTGPRDPVMDPGQDDPNKDPAQNPRDPEVDEPNTHQPREDTQENEISASN